MTDFYKNAILLQKRRIVRCFYSNISHHIGCVQTSIQLSNYQVAGNNSDLRTLQVCDALLTHKAFINSKSRVGWTALHLAAMNGFADLCRYYRF